MLRSIYAHLLGLALACSPLALVGCASEVSPEASEATGTLSLPLLSQVGAHTYRLEGGFYVNGPVFRSLDMSSDSLSTVLPTGDYQAVLYSWELKRDDGTGTFQPVAATLVSSYWQPFTIFNGATSTVIYEFETDGLLVTVGAGALNVKLDVDETAPACTPLGTDCGAGAWCPPPELSGSPARCVSEGPSLEGDACSSPLDCAANTSCFDFGAGAHCVQLCASVDFGLPCSAGGTMGTCTAQGADYGVCVAGP